MEMTIDFPGGARVDAHFDQFTVPTDQSPLGGGESSAPTPFATFLASIGTCAGIYVLGFCKQRGISTEGVQIIQRMHSNPMEAKSRVLGDIRDDRLCKGLKNLPSSTFYRAMKQTDLYQFLSEAKYS